MKSSSTFEHMLEVPKQICLPYFDSYKRARKISVIISIVIIETKS